MRRTRPSVSRMIAWLALGVGLALVTDPLAADDPDATPPVPRAPLVIAHRGASGLRPEHTLDAYRLAIQQGADFIEPDLVVTRDGVLVARHENELSGTMDVADRPEFAARRTTKRIDGAAVQGWFAEDFTLRELKSLRAKERIPKVRPGNTQFDGQLEIPTLDEIIDLVRQVERHDGRRVGIYPETKHPTYFAEEGRYLNWQTGQLDQKIQQSLGELLIRNLIRKEFTDPRRVFIQSFEFANLLELKTRIMPRFQVDLPLIQLYGDCGDGSARPMRNFARPYDMVFYGRQHASDHDKLRALYGPLWDQVPGGITAKTTYADLVTADVLGCLKRTYASGIGPSKTSLLPRVPLAALPGEGSIVRADGITTRLTGQVHPLLARALDAGLELHPYTLRSEPVFLTLDAEGRPQTIQDEIRQLLELGVTGFFIDQPGDGVLGRDGFQRDRLERDQLQRDQTESDHDR